MRIREKRRIISLLQSGGLEKTIAELRAGPGREMINPLFAGLSHHDEKIHWHAVTAMGLVVRDIADQDMEAARVVMRRLMWSLNDESGGIGWGAPEAMAEILANHQGLADEFAHILVAYMREDGLYLELPQLQRGLMWGIARMAQTAPAYMMKWQAPSFQEPYLDSPDAVVRGLAALSLGLLKTEKALAKIQTLLGDGQQVSYFWDRQFRTATVRELAGRAIKTMGS